MKYALCLYLASSFILACNAVKKEVQTQKKKPDLSPEVLLEPPHLTHLVLCRYKLVLPVQKNVKCSRPALHQSHTEKHIAPLLLDPKNKTLYWFQPATDLKNGHIQVEIVDKMGIPWPAETKITQVQSPVKGWLARVDLAETPAPKKNLFLISHFSHSKQKRTTWTQELSYASE